MKKLMLLVLAISPIAALYWLASPPAEQANQPDGVENAPEVETLGGSSAEELVDRYVESINQKDADAFLTVLHPRIVAELDIKDPKSSSWINSAQPMKNHSFKIGPISQYKLDSWTKWDHPVKPTHEISLKYDGNGSGTAGRNLYVRESDGQWYVVQPVKRNLKSPAPDTTVDSFVYHFEHVELHKHQWELSFKSDNPNDFQVVLVGSEESILLSTRQLNKDQHGRKHLHVELNVENTEDAESILIDCSIGSAYQAVGSKLKILGNQSLNWIPASQPARSDRDIQLGEVTTVIDGNLETYRLLVREHDPLTPEPRQVFLDL